jgi:hypothetical protein
MFTIFPDSSRPKVEKPEVVKGSPEESKQEHNSPLNMALNSAFQSAFNSVRKNKNQRWMQQVLLGLYNKWGEFPDDAKYQDWGLLILRLSKCFFPSIKIKGGLLDERKDKAAQALKEQTIGPHSSALGGMPQWDYDNGKVRQGLEIILQYAGCEEGQREAIKIFTSVLRESADPMGKARRLSRYIDFTLAGDFEGEGAIFLAAAQICKEQGVKIGDLSLRGSADNQFTVMAHPVIQKLLLGYEPVQNAQWRELQEAIAPVRKQYDAVRSAAQKQRERVGQCQQQLVQIQSDLGRLAASRPNKRPNNLLEGFSIQKRGLSTLQQSIDTGLPSEFAKHKLLQRRLLSDLISKQDFDEGKVVAVKELDDGGILAGLAKSNCEREAQIDKLANETKEFGTFVQQYIQAQQETDGLEARVDGLKRAWQLEKSKLLQQEIVRGYGDTRLEAVDGYVTKITQQVEARQTALAKLQWPGGDIVGIPAVDQTAMEQFENLLNELARQAQQYAKLIAQRESVTFKLNEEKPDRPTMQCDGANKAVDQAVQDYMKNKGGLLSFYTEFVQEFSLIVGSGTRQFDPEEVYDIIRSEIEKRAKAHKDRYKLSKIDQDQLAIYRMQQYINDYHTRHCSEGAECFNKPLKTMMGCPDTEKGEKYLKSIGLHNAQVKAMQICLNKKVQSLRSGSVWKRLLNSLTFGWLGQSGFKKAVQPAMKKMNESVQQYNSEMKDYKNKFSEFYPRVIAAWQQYKNKEKAAQQVKQEQCERQMQVVNGVLDPFITKWCAPQGSVATKPREGVAPATCAQAFSLYEGQHLPRESAPCYG